ncbi:MAG TPA: hemolysin family protein [Candidatus Eisenbacteria bacterium]|nr:hemolysin family protein [Candidatus Eisenbacteria bacterium]
MSNLNLFFLLAGFLVLAALFAAGETALLALPRLRLRRLARQATLFRQTLDHPHRVLVGLLLGSTLANVAATSVSALLVNRLLGHSLPLAALLALQVFTTSFVLLVFCEVAPKTYALEHGERFAVRLAPLLRIVSTVLRPAVNLLEGVSRAAARLFGGQGPALVGVEDLKTLLEEGKLRGSLTAEEAWLFEGAFRLRGRTAGAVMTARADLVMAPSEATTHDLIELVNVSGHSRLPVYEGTVDRIVGVVDVNDLLPFLNAEAPAKRAREIARPAFLVSPTRPVEALFADMQREGVQMVVVANDKRQSLGVVTVEDILEEIVGEIRGELEEEEPAVRLLENGDAIVRGNVRVSDVNRMLGTTLPSENGRTIEALARDLWREPLSEGDETETPGGNRLLIESLVGSRVWSVRVKPPRPKASA